MLQDIVEQCIMISVLTEEEYKKQDLCINSQQPSIMYTAIERTPRQNIKSFNF